MQWCYGHPYTHYAWRLSQHKWLTGGPGLLAMCRCACSLRPYSYTRQKRWWPSWRWSRFLQTAARTNSLPDYAWSATHGTRWLSHGMYMPSLWTFHRLNYGRRRRILHSLWTWNTGRKRRVDYMYAYS